MKPLDQGDGLGLLVLLERVTNERDALQRRVHELEAHVAQLETQQLELESRIARAQADVVN